MEILGYLTFILTIFFLGICFIEKWLKSRKKKVVENDGRQRFLRLQEYRVGRKRTIRTDPKYLFYTCIKGTKMENKEIAFHIDEEGFIEPSAVHNDAEISLAFVGDSTTECALAEPEFRYPYLVGRMIEKAQGIMVNSYNASMSSATSFSMITIVRHKLLPLKPKAIVWCSNIGDLGPLLNYKDWPEVCAQKKEEVFYIEEDLRNKFSKRVKSAIRMIFPELYTWLYSKKAKKTVEVLEEKSVRELKEEEKENIKEQILINLKLFIEICCFHNIVPVVTTQASIWKWGGRFTEEDNREIQIYKEILEGKVRIAYSAFVLLFEEVNQMIRDYCRKEKILFVDLEREVPKENRYIYDYVHYTNEGSKKAAECIYSVLKQIKWKE